MIKLSLFEDALYGAMKRAALEMPPDVAAKLEEIEAEETAALAKAHVRSALNNAESSRGGKGLVCADTGYPLYFIKLGDEAVLGFPVSEIYAAACRVTERLTAEAFLRPTMVDPLERSNPGGNVGAGMPKIEISFVRGNEVCILAAPKGGGSEIFGTFYRMLFPADGEQGICKFAIESIKDACYAGKICPPAIVGIGIGGTADLCMKIAKEAALLRRVGAANKNENVARLERKLLAVCRELGIGPMGSKGINCVMAVNIETALTHTAALPVAVNAQCLVGRRHIAKINMHNEITFTADPAEYGDEHE